jgi:hypothetical protein
VISADTKVTFDIDGAVERIDGATLRGLQLAGEHVLALSRRRVPIEEGTLERSGLATDDGHLTVAVSYDTPYAVRQHEDITLRHASGRTSKYLELAAAEAAPDITRIVAASAREAG